MAGWAALAAVYAWAATAVFALVFAMRRGGPGRALVVALVWPLVPLVLVYVAFVAVRATKYDLPP